MHREPNDLADPTWLDLDALFAAQGERLFDALYLVVGHVRDAERILQNAFLKLWERRGRNEPIGDPTFELFCEALSGIRMRRWRVTAAMRAKLGDRRDTFGEAGLDDGARHRLMDLSPRVRAALVLTGPLGFSLDDATDILRARSTSTIEALVRDGRRALTMQDGDDPDARLQELFASATAVVGLEAGAGHRQRARQRRVVRGRRVGAFATVGLVGVAIGAFVLTRPPPSTPAPAASRSPTTTTHPALLLPTIVPLHARWKPIVGLPSDAVMLALSADGRRIAYATFGSGLRACRGCSDGDGIGTARADGIGRTHPIDVPLDSGAPMMPAWSPDGRMLAFVRDRQIWVVDVRAGRRGDPTPPRRVTGGIDPESPTWSADGRTIAYVDHGRSRFHNAGLSQLPQIFSVRVDGSRTTQLTHDSVADRSPSYSPDGTRIAYSHDGAIWVMDADGSRSRLLVPFGDAPSWSPDGTKLAFLRFSGANAESPDLLFPRAAAEQPLASVEIFDLQRRKVRDLGIDTLGPYNRVFWTPDGRALLVNLYAPPRGDPPS